MPWFLPWQRRRCSNVNVAVNVVDCDDVIRHDALPLTTTSTPSCSTPDDAAHYLHRDTGTRVVMLGQKDATEDHEIFTV